MPAPVRAGQGLAVSRTKALDKAGIEVADGLDGVRPAFVLDLGRGLRILSVEVAQKSCASNQGAAGGLAGADGAVIAGDGPLVGDGFPTLCFPQDLQDDLCSDIALPHELDAALSEGLKAFVVHVYHLIFLID